MLKIEDILKNDFFNGGPVRALYLFNRECSRCKDLSSKGILPILEKDTGVPIIHIEIEYPPIFAPAVLPIFIIYSNGARFAELMVPEDYSIFSEMYKACLSDADKQAHKG